MEKYSKIFIYVFSFCLGMAIAYFMSGCKSTEKCDAYSKCAK